MNRVCVPAPRNRRALHRLWLSPTNLFGHLVARTFGCEDQGRVGGKVTPARLYYLPRGRMRGLGAIALGHVIVAERSFLAGSHGSWILAHELSHTRQHDFLGPFYLPVHAVLQVVSVLLSLFRPLAGFPPMHAYNPLERAFLCVPFDLLVDGPEDSARGQAVLRAFDLVDWSPPGPG